MDCCDGVPHTVLFRCYCSTFGRHVVARLLTSVRLQHQETDRRTAASGGYTTSITCSFSTVSRRALLLGNTQNSESSHFVLSLCLVALGHALGGDTFRFRCSFIGSQLCSLLRLIISEMLHEFLLFQTATRAAPQHLDNQCATPQIPKRKWSVCGWSRHIHCVWKGTTTGKKSPRESSWSCSIQCRVVMLHSQNSLRRHSISQTGRAVCRTGFLTKHPHCWRQTSPRGSCVPAMMPAESTTILPS